MAEENTTDKKNTTGLGQFDLDKGAVRFGVDDENTTTNDWSDGTTYQYSSTDSDYKIKFICIKK